MAQYQGKLLITVHEAHIVNFNTHLVSSITNAITSPSLTTEKGTTLFCSLSMADQVISTPKVPKTTYPQWDYMHTFNVFNPFAEVAISVAEDNGDIRNFGKLSLKLQEHNLVDQKLHELKLNISAMDSKDIIGHLSLNVQYKYRKTWEALYKGMMALSKQQYPAAVALFTHHLNSQADINSLYQVYDYRCEAYCGMGKLQEALTDAAKVLELRPGSILALIRLARVFVLRAEFEQAKKILDKAQAIAPEDERVLQENEICKNEELIYRVSKKLQAAYADFTKESYITAANHFSDTIDDIPNSAIVYLYRAICFAALGHLDSCMSDVQHLLDLQPGWPRTDAKMEGNLQKRGGVNVMMKRRWFILKNSFLFYYKTNNDVQPQGIICLHNAQCTVKGKRELSISSAASKRVYEMKSDSEEDRNKWSQALNEVISSKLTLPDMQDGAQIVANSRKIIQVNVVTDIFNKFHDGLFLPTKVVTTIGEKIISSLSTFELEPQDKRGWLYKKGRLTNDCEWARRFFVLKPPYLYYLNPGQDEDLSDGSVFVPRGYINLDTSQINPSPDKVAQAFAFEITPKSSMYLKQNIAKYMLSAESQSDFDSWVSTIKKVTDPPAPEPIPRALPPRQAEEPSQRQSMVLSVTDLDLPKPVNIKHVNYISDYKPPPDVETTAPAIKPSDAPPNDTPDGPTTSPTKTPGGPNSKDGITFYTPSMSPQYSLNYDPPPPANAKAAGVSDVESRFYKFGVPNPAMVPTPPQSHTSDSFHEPSENAPLLGESGETPGEKKEGGCCCTVM